MPSCARASFNQDHTYVALATNCGYAIHATSDGQRSRFDASLGATRVVEMLFTSSLLCVVGDGDRAQCSPRNVKVIDARSRKVLGTIACEVGADDGEGRRATRRDATRRDAAIDD